MKRLYTFLVAILLTASTFSQAPEKMSYQAVLRDSGDNLVSNQVIGMQISILQTTATGTAVYVETQTPTTNVNGLVTLEIGTGTPITGSFAGIDWSASTYFIKIETDPAGGTNYSITGTSQLLSVPYALHAKTVSSITETDPTVPDGITAGDMQYWNGSAWEVVEATPNEGATLQMIGGIPTWVGGTPPPTVPDAPTIGTAIAGDAQASVSFTVPVSDGGSPITGYTATSNPGGFTGTGTSPITVTGLSNGTAYTFSVTATNAIGTSNSSDASNSVTPLEPTVPDAPTIGTAIAGDALAHISFTAPLDDGGSPISYYTATSSPGGFTGTLSQAGSGTIIVSGLSNGTAYTFSITATNANGTSNSSTTSNSVTPQQGSAIVGELRAGGVVFWVDPADNTHGLVCALSDYATMVEWGCYGTDLNTVPSNPYTTGVDPAGLGAEIGDGVNNTNNILNDCPTAPAALAARSLGTEWFLPSVKELNQMFINKTTLEAVPGFTAFSIFYWSSTETDSEFAWGQYFDDGILEFRYKGYPNFPIPTALPVRAVKAF